MPSEHTVARIRACGDELALLIAHEVDPPAGVGRDTAGERFRQLALERLLIALGEECRRLTREAGLPRGAPPWAKAIQTRDVLAHLSLEKVDHTVLWDAARNDVPKLVGAAEGLLP